ncbi:MAG: hypothetical protein IJU58_01105 [Clostridia bacterium]|nr:hypothetical protein [Clostridia bacterium]
MVFFKTKSSLVTAISMCLLFVVGMAFTITYAYFSASRMTITTLNFHGGTLLTIVGSQYDTDNTNVGLSLSSGSNTGRWQSSTDNGAWTTSNSAVVNSSLRLSGLKVKAAQNSGTYVRAFVAVMIDAVSTSSATDGSIIIPTLTFTTDQGSQVADVSQANYTIKEQAFVTANTNANSTLYTACAVITLPDVLDFVKIFDHYTVFAKDTNNVQDGNYQFAHFSAMIMLTSSTANRSDIWQTSQDSAIYSFSY